MKICSAHKVEAVFKEGVSKKTGKAYSFWACPQKNGDQYCQAEIIDGEGVNPKSAEEFHNSLQDEKSRRIERQHSQEMALRLMEIEIKIDPEAFQSELQDTKVKDILKKRIEWFVKDVDNKPQV